MFIPQAEFKIEEDIGELLVPVHRSGDASQELMVVCHTHQGETSLSVLNVGIHIHDVVFKRYLVV